MFKKLSIKAVSAKKLKEGISFWMLFDRENCLFVCLLNSATITCIFDNTHWLQRGSLTIITLFYVKIVHIAASWTLLEQLTCSHSRLSQLDTAQLFLVSHHSQHLPHFIFWPLTRCSVTTKLAKTFRIYRSLQYF